ncbi:MAG: ribonuclease HII [Thermodesulfobacteriota bacterium]
MWELASPEFEGGGRLFWEKKLHVQGVRFIAGVDEAGRGPLAGPVVAAAVILPPTGEFTGVDDSKALSARQRAICDELIRRQAISIGIGAVESEEIDQINILQATLKAMQIAVAQLNPRPDYLLVDGIVPMPAVIPQKTIAQGDSRSVSIAAASIIAKVYRDALMDKYHEQYPMYNFGRNKGYGTREHRQAIKKHGCCPIHRQSFRGVREYVVG